MLLPMFAMLLLTTVVAAIAVTCRVRSVKNGRVKIKYYRLMQGENVPEDVIRTTRCVNNLFEVPVLFYVVCTLYISLNIHSAFALTLAWLFVGFRSIQALVHLTHNNVIHRMVAFWLAYGSVFLMWLVLVLKHNA